VKLDVCLRATRLWFIYAKGLLTGREAMAWHTGPWAYCCRFETYDEGAAIGGTSSKCREIN
jgi:hypothetical protein